MRLGNWLFHFLTHSIPSIDVITRRIENAIASEIRAKTTEEVWVTHYGANHVHPKHLVIWIVVRSDVKKVRLQQDTDLVNTLRGYLDKFEFPMEGRSGVHIGFESHETVNREANGDFFTYWK